MNSSHSVFTINHSTAKMSLLKENIELKFSNDTTCFSGDDTLSGEAHITVNNNRGIEVKYVSLLFDCSVLAKVCGSTQNEDSTKGFRYLKKKLLNKEFQLFPKNNYLASGLNKIPFEIRLPSKVSSLPPNCLDKIDYETRAQIRHTLRIAIKVNDNSALPVLSVRYNINIIPKSKIPEDFTTEEFGFMTHMSRYGGGKVTGKVSTIPRNFYQHKIKSIGINSDVKFPCGIVKTVLGRRNSKIPLKCTLSVPREGIKQDGSSFFNLKISTLNNSDTLMLTSLSLSIQTVAAIDICGESKESVVEMTPVYQRVLIERGNEIEVSGKLMMQDSILPSFKTSLLSHFHCLVLKAEVSRSDGNKVYGPTVLVESVPVHLLSNLHDTKSIDDNHSSSGHIGTSLCGSGIEESGDPVGAQSIASSSSSMLSKYLFSTGSSFPSSPVYKSDDPENTFWDFNILSPEEFIKSKFLSWFQHFFV